MQLNFLAWLRDKRCNTAPADVLFDAQKAFIEQKFRPYLVEIIQPTADKPAVFVCKVPPNVTLAAFRKQITGGIWGDFEPAELKIILREPLRGPMMIYVTVKRQA